MEEFLSNSDVTGTQYQDFLHFFSNKCETFECVIRNDIGFYEDDPTNFKFNHSAYAFLDRLSPFIISQHTSKKWAAGGTREAPADIFRYHFNEKSLELILQHTTKISDWVGPMSPEDLTLFANDIPVVRIIGHETITLINLPNADLELLLATGIELD